MATSVTSVKLDDDRKDLIQQLARRQHSEREEAKEQFAQEALSSWNSYKQTGKHLTGQEAREWLRSWGTDNEADIPACHD
ncbi:MAG: CopG family transcriptional regulator [Desulfuromonas sp.]|nr:MAG: CopG family transcriptional regulator [Desulfuromonas sp.]